MSFTINYFFKKIPKKNLDLNTVINKVSDFQIAIPSWALGTGGTRFGRFPQGGEPNTLEEKIKDASYGFFTPNSIDKKNIVFKK